MTNIPASLRALVVQRAGSRCEYCGISQLGQVATFHIDHVIPVVAGGGTKAGNLALACVSCSLRKGARQVVPDMTTGESVRIFNPRQQTAMARAFCLGRGCCSWFDSHRTSNDTSFRFEPGNHVSHSHRRRIAGASPTAWIIVGAFVLMMLSFYPQSLSRWTSTNNVVGCC